MTIALGLGFWFLHVLVIAGLAFHAGRWIERVYWTWRIRVAGEKRHPVTGELDPARGIIQLYDDCIDQMWPFSKKAKATPKPPPKDALQ